MNQNFLKHVLSATVISINAVPSRQSASTRESGRPEHCLPIGAPAVDMAPNIAQIAGSLPQHCRVGNDESGL